MSFGRMKFDQLNHTDKMVDISIYRITKDGVADHYEVVLNEPGNYEEFGLKKKFIGKSAWEALMKMAENWKKTGYLE